MKDKKEKVIKLTEENLINIIKKIVVEQEQDSPGLAPFPEKQAVQRTQQDPMGEKKVVYGTHPSILKGKKVVKFHLEKAIDAMQQLTSMTGINTDTNDIVPAIKKAFEQFEKLFGDPQPDEDMEVED